MRGLDFIREFITYMQHYILPVKGTMPGSELEQFRYRLLSIICLTTSVFAFAVAILYLLNFYPDNVLYQGVLIGYGLVNFAAYSMLRRHYIMYYMHSVNIAIFSSLIVFSVLVLTATYDEFRFVWFFLTSFASFILGGKRYGLVISFIIVTTMLTLYATEMIELSKYGIFTFNLGLFALGIFAFSFLHKIESDAALLQQRVIEEVEKRQTQEHLLLRHYRMTNMGEMIDAIAHQWRQPLAQANMILLNIDDVLEEETPTKEYIQSKITELSGLTAHMSQTIEDFRDLLRDDKDKTTFRVTDTLKEVLGFMKNHLKDIAVTYDQSGIAITNYKNELVQVLIILLSNAAEALESAGTGTGRKRISISIVQTTDDVTLVIEDNAGGIENCHMDRLFDPYFTTKKQSGGTGLGLYIAKIIIEQNMQGVLSVARGEQGARFTIMFARNP